MCQIESYLAPLFKEAQIKGRSIDARVLVGCLKKKNSYNVWNPLDLIRFWILTCVLTKLLSPPGTIQTQCRSARSKVANRNFPGS